MYILREIRGKVERKGEKVEFAVGSEKFGNSSQ